MQIYDIIFLVWSLWVGVFEHQAFKKIGNISGYFCFWIVLLFPLAQ